MRNLSRLLQAATVVLVLFMGVDSAHSQLLINAAGSTFGYPIYSKWFDEYAKLNPNIHFNYQSIGSGGGIMMLRNRTVAVGASDAPLTSPQEQAMPGAVLHFPSVMGAVVLMYNLPQLKTHQLRLTGPLIVDIYLGKVTKWNDPAIAKLNPGADLPNEAILTVHRSEGSGTTFIFSDYLAKVSPEWLKVVGRGTSLKWPVGLGGKGSEGVTGVVQQTPGAMGYVELTYALANKIPFAEITNHDGKWVKASLASVTAAAAGAAANMPADFRVSITNARGADAYPISSFTWLLVYKQQSDHAKGEAIVKFLKWALTEGQKDAASLYYAPLPKAVVDKELAQITEISVPAK
ncbi:MAG: phosphate ABC transporter substrate-binding protein PstS [Candidatus Binataceae bacterium]